jgi:hypothetical protein
LNQSFVSLAPWVTLALVVAGAGVLAIIRRTKRPAGHISIAPKPAPVTPIPAAPLEDRAALRSYALDVLGEAVLILDGQGLVQDCNNSALTLFDRHRESVEEQYASTLRRFEGLDQSDPHRVASQHALWVGEAWARQPDGGVKLCIARVMSVRDSQAQVTGFVESFRDVTAERALSEEFRDLLYGVRAFDSVATTPKDAVRAVQEDLRLLSEAFRDLDLVIRQYERLLPTLAADDPLTESIAGMAHDTRSAAAAVGVSALLEEIPRALSRLRSHLQQVPVEIGVAPSGSADEAGTRSSIIG